MRFSDIRILIYAGFIMFFVSLFCVWAIRERYRLRAAFAEKGLLEKLIPSDASTRAVRLMALRVAAVIFIFLALALPQWGFFWEENTFSGIDIMIAIDTSKSMLARDEYPDRLGFAKENIRRFVEGLNTDRVGLIAFAGDAFLKCPLTLDYGGFLLVLNSVNTDSVPRGGTSLVGAVEEAARTFDKEQSENRLLVLVTDGEDTSGEIAPVIEKAVDSGIVVSCVGIGSTQGAEIPLPSGGYVLDKNGEIVISTLDELSLMKIASGTGGEYVRAGQGKFGLREIYDSMENRFYPEERQGGLRKVYRERFQIFLGLALICLLFEMIMEKRRYR